VMIAPGRRFRTDKTAAPDPAKIVHVAFAPMTRLGRRMGMQTDCIRISGGDRRPPPRRARRQLQDRECKTESARPRVQDRECKTESCEPIKPPRDRRAANGHGCDIWRKFRQGAAQYRSQSAEQPIFPAAPVTIARQKLMVGHLAPAPASAA